MDNQDYQEWEKQSNLQIEKNNKLLQEFYDWLSDKNLSEKTIKKHVGSIDFYINEFLIRWDVTSPAEGIIDIDTFLGDWFIRKAMWASKTSINDYCAGFKKFYKFMLEKELITIDDYYDYVIEEIKENKDEWLAALQKFDDLANLWD